MSVPATENLKTWRSRYYYVMKNTTSGKLYAGQTTQNIQQYLGSGTYWINHCKAHGGYNKNNIELLEYHWFDYENDALQWLNNFENKNSEYWLTKEWANQTQENTLDNPWYGSSTNDCKVKNGTHPFLEKNRCDAVKNAGKNTRFGTEKYINIIKEKYGVDNIMKVEEIAKKSGENQKKIKQSKQWKETVEPIRIEKFNKTMNTIDDNGKTKRENRNQKIGAANKERNLERVNAGSHHYIGGFYAVLKNGLTKKITKEEYKKHQVGKPENWLYAHPTSNEGKRRRSMNVGS